MRIFALASLSLALAGCSVFDGLGKGRAAPGPSGGSDLATEFAPAVSTTALGAAGHSAAALDKTSEAEKAAALAQPTAAGERELGKAVVALGPPAETGLWVQSVLVSSKGQGRVVAPNGQSLAVELRPGSGGALMSLSAYQALGLSLTSLPELTIFGG
ncbi:hypothetical protein HOY34_13320 [Xinfangfangia sp. D13-10-4-6]|uniref:hypothetical protein n=1 Tax=Pseudogemmobacter hezensis TaxID=2737662 RepID=UPI0015573657|nr:hypothetical protein [Pseudogemmobacter hezensis]NPD16177.1 hypothetical protein [Pseudogemmobacter hezensis]